MDAARHPVQSVAAIPAVALAADATSTLRVGFRVLCVDYHHPVVLAKELATLDLFSDGRLEIGLGAGWISSEYEAMGLHFDRAGARIDRLGEVIDLLKQCFAEGPVDISGNGLRASGFEGAPKPLQKPWPPIAIGGGGRRVLELAAREADIVAVNMDMRSGQFGPEGVRLSTSEVMDEKVQWIREAAGERFASLECEIGVHFVMVTDDADSVLTDVAQWTNGLVDLPPDDAREHPHVLVGSASEICDTLEDRRERYGFSYITVQERVAAAFSPVVDRLSGR
jgi:probable F420-dependent oxidoreductase